MLTLSLLCPFAQHVRCDACAIDFATAFEFSAHEFFANVARQHCLQSELAELWATALSWRRNCNSSKCFDVLALHTLE